MSQSFLRHTAVYGIGSLLVPAASFLLLPLYTRALVPAEYGVLEILSRAGEVAVFILLFRGIRQAVLALHGRTSNPEERARVIASAFTVVGIIGAVGIAGAGALAGPLAGILDQTTPGLLACGLIAMLLEGMATVLMVVPQARLESGHFVFLTVSHLLVRIALCVVWVTILGWGVWGVILASLVTSFVLLALLVGREVALGLPGPDMQCVREILRFSWPFLPAGVGCFLINNGDRFFLLRYCSAEEVGVYSLGYKLAMAVVLVSRTPPGMVWSARMYDAAQQENAPEIFGRVFTRMLAAYVFIGMALCFFQNEVVFWLAGDRYRGAAAVIAPVVLAYFFSTVSDLMDGGLYVTRRTDLKPYVTLLSAVVVVVLYVLLIPPFGMMGAAYATVAAFAVSAALTYYLSQRVFPVRYEWGRLTLLLGMAVAMTGVAGFLPVELWTIPVKLLLLALTPALLWFTGAFHAEECELRELVRALYPRLAGWWLARRGGHAESDFNALREVASRVP
jgi:O-antigen/teichoic acid export membrane protein